MKVYAACSTFNEHFRNESKKCGLSKTHDTIQYDPEKAEVLSQNNAHRKLSQNSNQELTTTALSYSCPYYE
jgi:hypothetical protein